MKAYSTAFQPRQIHHSVFIAAGAVVVGDVTMEADASIWFSAVLRGDAERIRIGAGSNIQDGAIGHADPGLPLLVGEGATVGHGAIVHGARIGDHSLIGMGAIVMNGACVGDECLVGAGALVTQGQVFHGRSLILGAPAKRVRTVTAEELAMMRRTAAEYARKARAYKSG